ncbi:MAG: hypothetical protein RLZZ502_1753 [Pseudomonadota bacterium]|jgi:two-component system sensor histidine kinase GlrK
MAFPQTLTKLIVGTFVLTAVPLLVALVQLALTVNELATQSQLAVKRGELAGAVGLALRESSLSLERSVRQAVVLEDESLLTVLRSNGKRTEEVAEKAMLLPVSDEDLLRLANLNTRIEKLLANFARGIPPVGEREAVVKQMNDIADQAEESAKVVTAVSANEIAALQNKAYEGRDNWPYLIGAAAVLALILGLGFSFWVSRPLRSLDLSMRRLGQARFDEPVQIKGPKEMESLGQRLEWLRHRLHTLENEQTRFLQQVSHELKTPLTAIREGGELLHERVTGELTAGQDDIVRIIRDNSVQLQKHINDLLNYQQHRSGVPLRVESLILSDLIVQVLREHKLDVLAKGIQVKPKLTPITMAADRDRLRVILDNLVSNALKFSPKGGIITLSTQLDTLDGTLATLPAAVILVEDQGVGVKLGEEEKIFASFYQGSHQPEAIVKGSGLGLAIVREYVQAHGGRIKVLRPGESGGRLECRLPLSP